MKNQKNHCLNIKVEGLETDSFELEEEFISAEGKVDLDGDGKEDRIYLLETVPLDTYEKLQELLP